MDMPAGRSLLKFFQKLRNPEKNEPAGGRKTEKKKDLGKDKFGVQRVMRRRNRLGGSPGRFALNAMGGTAGRRTVEP